MNNKENIHKVLSLIDKNMRSDILLFDSRSVQLFEYIITDDVYKKIYFINDILDHYMYRPD